jgi:hypothetical protein
MPSKYLPSDDGKVVDGKTIVFLSTHVAELAEEEPVARQAKAGAAPAAKRKEIPGKVQAAEAQAAALTAAAKDGVPFCEECERARKALAGKT